MNKDAPCHGCDVRFLGCQSVCFKYEEWKLTRAAEAAGETGERGVDRRQAGTKKGAERALTV